MATIKITLEWSVSKDRFSKQSQVTIDYLRPISIKFQSHNDEKVIKISYVKRQKERNK